MGYPEFGHWWKTIQFMGNSNHTWDSRKCDASPAGGSLWVVIPLYQPEAPRSITSLISKKPARALYFTKCIPLYSTAPSVLKLSAWPYATFWTPGTHSGAGGSEFPICLLTLSSQKFTRDVLPDVSRNPCFTKKESLFEVREWKG
jgi:hypothetical protein